MQPGVRWFKGPAGGAFRFECGSEGIHIPSLAAKVQLKVRPLELNGVVVDFNQQTGYKDYKSLEEAAGVIGELGSSAQNPIQVSGQPAEKVVAVSVGSGGGGATPAAPRPGDFLNKDFEIVCIMISKQIKSLHQAWLHWQTARHDGYAKSKAN